MLFEITKNLGKSSVTHILLATEEQTTKKSLLKLRFEKNPPVANSRN